MLVTGDDDVDRDHDRARLPAQGRAIHGRTSHETPVGEVMTAPVIT